VSDRSESDGSTRAVVLGSGLIDLGHLPERIRRIAGFWGGSTAGTQALYELCQTDGLARSVGDLRSAIARVHDHRVRDEFLVWLDSRTE